MKIKIRSSSLPPISSLTRKFILLSVCLLSCHVLQQNFRFNNVNEKQTLSLANVSLCSVQITLGYEHMKRVRRSKKYEISG
jgi:uncharacterized membrane protein YqhA